MFTAPQSLTRFLFDVASPETQGHGQPAPWCRRFNFFACIVAWNKRSLNCTEDHVEFVLAELAPHCQHHFKDRAEEGRIRTIEEGGERLRLVESDTTQRAEWMGAPVDEFRERD